MTWRWVPRAGIVVQTSGVCMVVQTLGAIASLCRPCGHRCTGEYKVGCFVFALVLLPPLVLSSASIPPFVPRSLPPLVWADLKEDRMINPAPGFRPARGPGSPGTAPARTIVQVSTNTSPGDQL